MLEAKNYHIESSSLILQKSITTKPVIRSLEDIWRLIGSFGKWQIVTFSFIAFMQFECGMISMAILFIGITPKFYCAVMMPLNNWTIHQTQNMSILPDTGMQDPCKVRYINWTALSHLSFADSKKSLEATDNLTDCKEWVFENTVDMRQTIVTQFSLVCSRKHLVEHSQFIYMAGYLIGSLITGVLSDRYGRKTVHVCGSVLVGVFGIAEAFAPNYPSFLVLALALSICSMASSLSGFCLGLELTTTAYRIWIGGLFYIPYALGYTSVAGVAFLTRDWRLIQIVTSLPCFLVLLYCWILPESPRWLLTKGYSKKAETTIRKAARWNKRILPDDMDFQQIAATISNEARHEKDKQAGITAICEYPVLLRRTLVLCVIWLFNDGVYTGLALNVSSFSGNRFINNAIAGAVEIPSYIACVPLLYWGRKKALCTMLFIAGISLVVVPWLPNDPIWLQTFVAMIGKLGIASSFAIGYVFTLELYPTIIRNSGLAVCSFVARFGSMAAPYIAGISKMGGHYRRVPVLIFGVMAFGAGLLSLTLPETCGKELLDYPEKTDQAKCRLDDKNDTQIELQERNFSEKLTQKEDRKS